MTETKYYDGTKLLSMMDINGNKPEIYLVTSNRTAGKTTYFGRYLVNKFIKENKKFCLLYRFSYELDDCATKFFKDIQTLFFPVYDMRSESRSKGMYHELFLIDKTYDDNDEEGVPCGYAIALNNADAVKKNSHLFSDIQYILFDEFQSESNHYCPKEVNKFMSIHDSIARGQGKQNRYVPVYMLSNTVSIINPYYVALGISNRLDTKTKFLRGNGFVLEQGYNESASKAMRESAFHQAFMNNGYDKYATTASYLNDNSAFIGKMSGKNFYLFTMKFEGKEYAVREYPDENIVYVSDNVDGTFKNKIAIDLESHDINYVLLNRYSEYITRLRFFFDHGCFRFKNQECKNALIHLLCYKQY